MRTGTAAAAGAGGTALLVAVAVLAYGLGRQAEDGDSFASSKASATPTGPSALRHAYNACVAHRRPSQISSKELRPVTEDESDAAQFEADSEAALAAALDPRWKELQNALRAYRSSEDFRRWFPVARAQCQLAGAGDIGLRPAEWMPGPPPP